MTSTDSQRALLSLTGDDVIALENMLREYLECKEKKSHADRPIAVEWVARFANMRYHMTDRVPLHYTDLGTTP